MNKKVFSEIFSRYKENYEYLNDPNDRDEIYKWPAVKCCIDNWDINAEDFLGMFKKSMSLSLNIIENNTKYPINGITFRCEQGKTEQVREEFRRLLSDDEDIRGIQDKTEAFQDNINAVLSEIAPDKWRFMQDRRDPLMYLAFIKPERSYMFKAEPARVFSNYVEFGDDIGSGQLFRLDNYYRLCDEVLAEIEADEEFGAMLDAELENAAERNGMDKVELQGMPGKFRIAVYDIMYCANSVWLYEGMEPPVKKGSKEEKERILKMRVGEIHELMDKENAELEDLIKDAPDYPDLTGVELKHVRYGKGTVKSQERHYLNIEYNGEERTFTLPDCITGGYLKGATDEVVEICRMLSEIEEKKSDLTKSLKRLRNELALLE